MRPSRVIVLLLIGLLALSVAPAAAQIPTPTHGIVHATVASVNAANTTAEILLYEYPIPAAYIASWTSANIAYGAAPLHLRLNGGIRTLGSSPTATLGINLGGALATMVLVNGSSLPTDYGSGTACAGAAQGPGACQAPVAIDIVISPIATLTTQNCTDLRPCQYSMFMSGKFVAATTTQTTAGTFATEANFNAATLATINNRQPATLKVLWRWGGAASGNSLNIYNGVLKLGF